MTEVVAYKVSVTDKDGRITYYSITASKTTLSTDNKNNPLIVDVGGTYVVAVQSENIVGASDSRSTSLGE